MADAAAPSAPAAAPAQTTQAAPGAPAAKPVVTVKPTVRANNGQFLPKDGTQGVVPPDAPQQPGETKAEAQERRIKGKAKVFGVEETYDYAEEDVRRLHQRNRAYEKKQAEYQEGTERAKRLFELASQDPEAFLREMGKDPDQWARERLARAAKVGAMDEHERKAYELEQELSKYKTAEQKREQEAQKTAAEAKQKRLIDQLQGEFIPAMEKSGLPKTADTLFRMAAIKRGALDQDGIELTADEIASDAKKYFDELADRHLGTLDGPGLVAKLGPQRIEAILAAVLADHDQKQTYDTTPKRNTAQPLPQQEKRKYLTETEVAENMRRFRNGEGL